MADKGFTHKTLNYTVKSGFSFSKMDHFRGLITLNWLTKDPPLTFGQVLKTDLP